MITSMANPQIKEVVALRSGSKARRKAGLFVVEGRRLTEEVPADMIRKLYVTEAFAASAEGMRLCEQFCGRTETVSEAVFAKMADTDTPQGALAVVKQPSYTPEQLCGGNRGNSLLLCEHVQDPGNMGTLFRTAEAAGFGGIILDRESADPLQPKTVRSTMGAIYRLPFYVADDPAAVLEQLHGLGYRSYAAHLGGEKYYDEIQYPEKIVFLLGNEGNGLSDRLTAAASEKLRIPMEGQAESLNVAVAGAVLMYERYRRLRQG